MVAIVAVVPDMHVNSTVALCPPRYELDDGGIYYPSKSQSQLWEWWLDYWRTVKKFKKRLKYPVIVVLCGETGDLNRHSQYQLISINESDIVRAVLSTLMPALEIGDLFYICRGTEAHVGGASWIDETVAREIGSVRSDVANSHYFLKLDFPTIKLGFQHHPGTNSMRPWTQGNAANRAAAMLTYAFYGEEWRPDLVHFGHVHHDEDSYDNHPIRAVYMPSWKLHGAYDGRAGRTYQRPTVGANIIIIDDNETTLHKFRRSPIGDEPCQPLQKLRTERAED